MLLAIGGQGPRVVVRQVRVEAVVARAAAHRGNLLVVDGIAGEQAIVAALPVDHV